MKSLITLAACMLLAASAIAQETTETQQSTQTQNEIVVESSDAGGIIMMSSSDDGVESNMRVMSFDASEMGGSPFMPGIMGDSGNSFELLNNPGVQKDLELIDDQLERIKAINKDFGKKMAEQIKAMRGENGQMDLANIGSISSLIKELKDQQKKEIEGLLLPQQQERLKQVGLQMRLKNRGTASTLTGQLAKELNLTGDQVKRIKKRQDELKKELEEKIAKLKEESRKSLLEELTNEQRKKYDAMIGDRFEPPKADQRRMRMQLQDSLRGLRPGTGPGF